MRSAVAQFARDAARALILLDIAADGAAHRPFDAWATSRGLHGTDLHKVATTLEELHVVEDSGNDHYEFTDHVRIQFDHAAHGSKASMAVHEWNQQALWVSVDSALRGSALDLQQDRTLPQVPGRLATLLSAMKNADLDLAAALAQLPWPPRTQLWDVAGGTGRLSFGVASSNRACSIEARVIDHPIVQDAADALADSLGVPRAFVGADVLAALLPSLSGLDVDRAMFMFSRCLHNFSPSIQESLLFSAWELSSGPVRLAVVNPYWDWDDSGGVVNPGVALFGFYMAVNAYGGGVPSRGEMAGRLGNIGSVARSSVSATLDLFVVGIHSMQLDSWQATRVSAYERQDLPDLEAEFDEFIPLSLCNVAVDWGLPEFLAQPRAISEVEKHIGLPRALVNTTLAALVAIGMCRRDADMRFRWVVSIDSDDREVLRQFLDCWYQLAEEVPGPVSVRTMLALVHSL